ncbi:hypothetical protein [Streptomyces sp. NPDC059013]|uniref:hypothetical protein n=1 Tax=unclassified Streptomyces TaxID=2593676 RepID=UPI0036C574E6
MKPPARMAAPVAVLAPWGPPSVGDWDTARYVGGGGLADVTEKFGAWAEARVPARPPGEPVTAIGGDLGQAAVEAGQGGG